MSLGNDQTKEDFQEILLNVQFLCHVSCFILNTHVTNQLADSFCTNVKANCLPAFTSMYLSFQGGSYRKSSLYVDNTK